MRLGAAGNKRRWFFRLEVERRAEDGRQHAHAASPPADCAAAHEDGEGTLARVFRAHQQTRMSGGGVEAFTGERDQKRGGLGGRLVEGGRDF